MAASCPICYQPATGATYRCPGCQATYHGNCWPQTGCVVPNCQRPTAAKKPASPLGPDASPLWRVSLGGAATTFVLFVVTIFAANGGPGGADGVVGLLGLAALVTVGSAALASVADLASGAAAGRWLGTLATAVATWSMPLLVYGFSARDSTAYHAWEKLLLCALAAAAIGLLVDRNKDACVVNAIWIILVAIAVPNFRAARERHPGPRACYANQKTIVGAIEMYNLDKNTKRTDLNAGFFMALKSGGYLQSIPQDPGEGAGTSSNYQVTGTGNGITCVKHGPIQIEQK